MPYLNRTYRVEDGERIEGSWRHIFIKNGGTYFLSDLKVYADGMIDCWGLVNFATFQQKVASGWVATTLKPDAKGSASLLASWRFHEPTRHIEPQDLLAEVADEIEHLAGRPTSEDRCRAALDHYLDEQSEENLAALRTAYVAVPEHLRMFLLGDQDVKDIPLRVLITPVGELLYPKFGDTPRNRILPERRENALKYFYERREEREKRQKTPPPWEDDAATINPSVVRFDHYDDGQAYLSNDYPASITIDGHTFPTVEHAYWALAVNDSATREKIMEAPTAHEASKIGQGAELHPNWNARRLAVMLRLVREKFRQHPDLAAQLLATGDGRLINGVDFSHYWGAVYDQGRNWLGRILELVRAELVENEDH